MKGGYIKLHRQIVESSLWSKPSDWMKIWIYVLSEVNYSDSSSLQAGQGYLTYAEIARNCKCSYRVVENFFKWAKESNMVWMQKSTRGNVITVLNYTKFQTDVEASVETDVEASVDAITKEKKNKRTITKKPAENTEAMTILSEYKNTVGGDMSSGLKNISSWLKQFSADELIYAVRKYAKEVEDKQTSQQYRKKCSNFFGLSDKETPFFKQYMTSNQDKEKADETKMIDFLWDNYEGNRIYLADGRYVLVSASRGVIMSPDKKPIGEINTRQTYELAVRDYQKRVTA